MQPQQPATCRQTLSSKTCDLCKIRHQKCSRTRPSCTYCQIRRANCTYSDLPANKATHPATVPAGTSSDIDASPRSSTADENSRVNKGVFDAETAAQTVGQSGDQPIFDSTPSTTKTQISSGSSISLWTMGSCRETSTSFLHDHLASFWAERLSKDKDQILEEIGFADGEVTTLSFLSGSGHQNFISLEAQLPDQATATVWLSTFLRGPNMLFKICDDAESWRLLDAIYGEEHITDASKSSIWLQLATGCRYTTGTVQKTYTRLFDSGCQYLEWSIEQADEVSPLWVLPSMLLNCLYTLDSKPKTCWLTLGSAIRLAQVHNIDRGKQDCSRLLEDEYERWRQVWRAIIFLDAWLSITLGQAPQISQNTTQDSLVNMTLEDFTSPDPSIEVKHCQIECLDQPLPVIPKPEEDNLRYFPNIAASQLLQADEVGSLYLEAFYFAAVITLTKPEFFMSLSAQSQQKSPLVRLFSRTCVDASAQIGHIALRTLERGFLCKRSWLITTLVYHAGLVLSLSLSVQMMSLRYNLKPLGSQNVEIEGLKANMNVLSACASESSLASHHHQVLRYFRNLIKNCEDTSYISASKTSGRELFGMPCLQPMSPSWGDSNIVPTNSMNFPTWHTSTDTASSTSSGLSSSPYIFSAGSNYSFSTTNEPSQPAVAHCPGQTGSDPSAVRWTAPLPQYGSSHAPNETPSSHLGSIDYGSGHYKPYMENLWSADAFESAKYSEA